MDKKKSKKVRVNITVDEELLKQAQKKLKLFGGKLSTLFNIYLEEFVKSMDQMPSESHEKLVSKIEELEERIQKLESR